MADETTPAPLSDAALAKIAERAESVGGDVWEIREGFNGRIGSIGPLEGYDGDALGLREGDPLADFISHAPADIPRLLATIAALQRQVDAAHLDVAYQVTAADSHAHHLHEADAARDRQIDDLTHERDQLLSEKAAMREVVAAVADNSSHLDSGTRAWECPLCFASTPETSLYDNPRPRIRHSADCPVTRARALLGTPPTPDSAGQS